MRGRVWDSDRMEYVAINATKSSDSNSTMMLGAAVLLIGGFFLLNK